MASKQLNYGSALFFIIIMMAVAFCILTSRGYQTSNARVAKQFSETAFFSYAELHSLLSNEDSSGFLIVDLRSSEDFEQGHITGAINIPKQDLLKRQNRKKLRGKQRLLLYSSSEHLAVAAQVILLGQGFERVNVIPGSYETINAFAIKEFNPAKAFFSEDKAQFDYSRFMNVRAVKPARQAPVIPGVPEVEYRAPGTGGC
ncbi:MAG: rhodanese-like domain-containing protein [Bacteroidales bacterium]|nr:rhodanese-like domain-containing protein [Bacteroidales bacterium]